MLVSLVFVSFSSFLISGLFGHLLGVFGVRLVNSFGIFCSFILSLLAFIDIGCCGNRVLVVFCSWLDVSAVLVDWSIILDSLSVVMLILVSFVSFLVHLYSFDYMLGDSVQSRYFVVITLFTCSMYLLIVSSNYLVLFTGYELIGVCSYLLINHWNSRLSANKASLEAMVVNRLGDLFFSLGFFFMFVRFRSLEYSEVFGLFLSDATIGCLLVLGSMGKSAQLGLHVWLPNAMEGPTSVSALIHAATLVTAGVYLVLRSSGLLESYVVVVGVSIIGSFTLLYSGVVGFFQTDLKKVIAYSTCSQVGYMMLACGLFSYKAGLFHVLTHGFFKGLLFLSAGSLIHSVGDEQDVRRLGGLSSFFPYTYTSTLVGSLALMGVPFLSGFYSKDTFLEVAYVQSFVDSVGLFVYCLALFGVFSTSYYSTRLFCLVYWGFFKGSRVIVGTRSGIGLVVKLPLFCLSLASIFGGYLLQDFFVGPGSCFWLGSIDSQCVSYPFFDREFIWFLYKLFPFLGLILGVCYSILVDRRCFWFYTVCQTVVGLFFYRLFSLKWYFDKVYVDLFGQFCLRVSDTFLYRDLDRGVLEWFGPRLAYRGLFFSSFSLSRLVQTGELFHYLCFLGLFCIFYFCLYFI